MIYLASTYDQYKFGGQPGRVECLCGHAHRLGWTGTHNGAGSCGPYATCKFCKGNIQPIYGPAKTTKVPNPRPTSGIGSVLWAAVECPGSCPGYAPDGTTRADLANPCGEILLIAKSEPKLRVLTADERVSGPALKERIEQACSVAIALGHRLEGSPEALLEVIGPVHQTATLRCLNCAELVVINLLVKAKLPYRGAATALRCKPPID